MIFKNNSAPPKPNILIEDSVQSQVPKPPENKFEYWINRNPSFNPNQSPVILQEYFRNLQNPLEFIKDRKIQKLETESDFMVDRMRKQRQIISEMSKQNYKKVMSRERNQFNFKEGLGDGKYSRSGYQQLQKREGKKKDDNTQVFKKRQELTKQFIHNSSGLDYEQKGFERRKRLNLDIIQDLDSKDLQEKYKNVQYIDVFQKNDDQKHVSTYGDISQYFEIDQLFNKLRLEIIDRDSYYSEKSNDYLFKSEQELDFWRRYTTDNQQIRQVGDEIDVLKKCHNLNTKQPSYLHMLDFASGKINSEIIASYFRIKSRHDMEMKIDENDENLEEQYNKKKQQYDFLREMKIKDKTQRVAVKYTKNDAQTIDNLQDISFDSYFQQNASDLILKIKEYNRIRDTVMQKNEPEKTKKVMLMNIGYELKDLLFRLLCLVFQGETFFNYEQIVQMNDRKEAQKKILQAIYHDFNNFQKLQVDGISKTLIVDTYLQQREKNEKMFELLSRTYPDEKQKPVSQKIKKPVANTNKKK